MFTNDRLLTLRSDARDVLEHAEETTGDLKMEDIHKLLALKFQLDQTSTRITNALLGEQVTA